MKIIDSPATNLLAVLLSKTKNWNRFIQNSWVLNKYSTYLSNFLAACYLAALWDLTLIFLDSTYSFLFALSHSLNGYLNYFSFPVSVLIFLVDFFIVICLGFDNDHHFDYLSFYSGRTKTKVTRITLNDIPDLCHYILQNIKELLGCRF